MNTNKQKSDDRYFRTSNFYLASFLFAKGLELVNIDRVSHSKRAYFVFADKSEREEWIQAFNFGQENSTEASVDARKLITAIKMLKDKLYQDRF